MDKLRLEVGSADYLRAASCYIRMNVFVLERKLDIRDEFDQNDKEETIYSVLFDGTVPVATARFLPLTKNAARITRVATLKNYRGKQLGSKVIKGLERVAVVSGFKKILIHSELTAAGFYEKLGYVRTGTVYKEDGVSCTTLSKNLS
ncbi:acetyltransferase [Liquorilactobacillus sucicola DSM 21376 = JCM 15457]|nr:GNAT family N-acetyltransferase [Liquorilactobacillus sucicola]GAJ27090.1 acetyltransferase [Liquorilactobacillus sucicola DSM 21376 = JCM 15457]